MSGEYPTPYPDVLDSGDSEITAATDELHAKDAKLPSGDNLVDNEETRHVGYEHYFDDRRADNLEKLASRPKLQKLYKRAIAERHSLIKHVTLIDDTNLTENAYFVGIDTTTQKKVSAIHFNVEHNFENKEQEPGTQLFIKKLALQLGIDYKEMIQNKDAFDGFVLMHEFGHAADFIARYYIPLATDGKHSVSESVIEGARTFSDRYKSEKKNRLIDRELMSIDDMRQMKVLALNEDPNSTDPSIKERVRKAVYERIDEINATRYRQIPEEVAADTFAREMIMQNADLFFRPHNETDEGRGLIAIGKPSVDLDIDDWRDVVGLYSGTRLKMTRVERNTDGKVVKKSRNGEIDITEGVLDPMLVSERTLTVRKSDDIKDLHRTRPLGEIASVKARQYNGKFEYLLTDQDGRMAVVEIIDTPKQTK